VLVAFGQESTRLVCGPVLAAAMRGTKDSGSLPLAGNAEVAEDELLELLLHAASEASSAHSAMPAKRSFIPECPRRCSPVAYVFQTDYEIPSLKVDVLHIMTLSGSRMPSYQALAKQLRVAGTLC
jgi:hypothetical protein